MRCVGRLFVMSTLDICVVDLHNSYSWWGSSSHQVTSIIYRANGGREAARSVQWARRDETSIRLSADPMLLTSSSSLLRHQISCQSATYTGWLEPVSSACPSLLPTDRRIVLTGFTRAPTGRLVGVFLYIVSREMNQPASHCSLTWRRFTTHALSQCNAIDKTPAGLTETYMSAMQRSLVTLVADAEMTTKRASDNHSLTRCQSIYRFIISALVMWAPTAARQ